MADISSGRPRIRSQQLIIVVAIAFLGWRFAARVKYMEQAARLNEAVSRTDIVAIRSLLNAGADIYARTPAGVTALEYATRYNTRTVADRLFQERILDLMLRHARPVEIRSSDGRFTLDAAALCGRTDQIRRMLDQAGKVDASILNEPLAFAASGSHLETLRMLIERGADVSTLGSGSLIFPVDHGRLGIIRLLLEHGLSPDIRFQGNLTMLIWAVGERAAGWRDELARMLIEHGADVNARAVDGTTVLSSAAVCADAHMAIFKTLLERGARVNGSEGSDAPLSCATDTTPAVVALLLDRGARINATDRSGESALTFALAHHRLDIARLLVARGAHTDVLPIAARSCGPQELAFLLDHGARIERRDDAGNTALISAIHQDYKADVELLLNRGAKINVQNRRGVTPLLIAAGTRNGSAAIVRLLLDRGADLRARTPGGKNALFYAADRGNDDIVRLLLERGLDANSRDDMGETPLLSLLKFYNAHLSMVDLLLAHGAHVNIQDSVGNTPVETALEHRHAKIADQLLASGATVPR